MTSRGGVYNLGVPCRLYLHEFPLAHGFRLVLLFQPSAVAFDVRVSHASRLFNSLPFFFLLRIYLHTCPTVSLLASERHNKLLPAIPL